MDTQPGPGPGDGGPEAAPEASALEVERLLRDMWAVMRQRGRQRLAGWDVTPPQYDALVRLVRHGEMTMGELCQRLYLASSTVTDLVDRMERADLVQRVRDAHDRRVIRLKVSARGRAVIDEVLQSRVAYLGSILEELPAPEQARLVSAMREFHRHLTASAHQAREAAACARQRPGPAGG